MGVDQDLVEVIQIDEGSFHQSMTLIEKDDNVTWILINVYGHVEKAYQLVASLQGGRDLVEVHVAAQIWPLCKGWHPCRCHVKKIDTKSYKFLDFDFTKPCRFKSNDEFVNAVEVKACETIGKFITKERNLIHDILGVYYKHFNQIFVIPKISYGERTSPSFVA